MKSLIRTVLSMVAFTLGLADGSRGQVEFYDDWTCRHPALSGGFGSGKSYAACQKLLKLSAVNRGIPVAAVEPTTPMIKRILWPTLFDRILDPVGCPYVLHKDPSNMRLELPWGLILFYSGAVPERIVGTEIAGGYVDEAHLMRELAWINLDRRVRHPQATFKQLFAAFTPEAPAWPHERWGKLELYGEPLPPDYAVHYASTRDNKYLGEDYADKIASEVEPDAASAVLDGRFVSIKRGRVYYTFDIRENVTRSAQYEPTLPLGLAFDFNSTPGMHVEAVQENGGWLYVVGEVYRKGLTLEDACGELLDRYGEVQRAPVFIYGDATGRHSASKSNMYKILVDILRDKGYARGQSYIKPFGVGVNLEVPRANPSVADSCAATRAVLCSSTGRRALFVNPECKRLIADFQQVVTMAHAAEQRGRSYAGNPWDIYKDDPRLTHASDAVRYWIAKVRPQRGAFTRHVDYKVGGGQAVPQLGIPYE